MDKPITPNSKSQSENRTSANQLQTIFQYLEKHVATASMVSKATGVYQKNICRYKRDLERAGRLWEIKKDICKETGFKAWYLTTEKSKVVNRSQQLNMFEKWD